VGNPFERDKDGDRATVIASYPTANQVKFRAVAELDPLSGTFRWGWAQTVRDLNRFRVGTAFIGVMAAVLGALFPLPDNPTLTDRLVNGVVVAVLGIAVVAVTTFLFRLVLAPYQQRNALRLMVHNRGSSLQFGPVSVYDNLREDIGVFERFCLISVEPGGDETIRAVELVLEACEPAPPGVRYERLVVWNKGNRSDEATTQLTRGRSGKFAVLYQDWNAQGERDHWNFRYASGDLNPAMPFQRYEIKLTVYGDGVQPNREWSQWKLPTTE
jgi:hypothetical protein